MITTEKCREALKSDPTMDDMERVNCPREGHIGHSNCGWCILHDQPRFVCMCYPPSHDN